MEGIKAKIQGYREDRVKLEGIEEIGQVFMGTQGINSYDNYKSEYFGENSLRKFSSNSEKVVGSMIKTNN